jgi:uncharacterized protein with PIN domain
MIIDSSALISMLLDEPEAGSFCAAISNAAAIENDEPLLFKGTGFSHTDVRVAPAG